MSKRLTIFIAVACIAIVSIVVIFMKWSAGIAQKKSDGIMEQFKTVDWDLQKTNEGLDSLNRITSDSLIKATK
jgi:hypothetical protein